ncbi:MAG: helix-turn-helix domain-containing protein [Clostridiales bacterium]|nr:helix-turn-helix domain-containing protein [Clostridiales bacterium]
MRLMIKGLHIDELVIFLDDEEEQTEPDQEEPEKEEPTQEEPKEAEPKEAEHIEIAPKKIKRKPLDKGKIGALYKAGWSVAKIADEMRCGQSTIYKTIKELGL